VGGNAPKCLWSIPTNGNICSKIKAYDYCFLSFLSQFTHKQGKYDLKMAFKKQLVTIWKRSIWGEILGGNAPNYALWLLLKKISETLPIRNVSLKYTF
jgi:hypothetical protein